MRVPLSSRSERKRERDVSLQVSADLAQVGRLQRDLERAQAHYEREIAQLGTTVRPSADRRFAPALTRSACFEDLLELGLSSNQARRVLQYLDEHSLAKLQNA